MAAYIAGFIAAGFLDLAIAKAVYSPQNMFPMLMEAFGWYPAFLPALLGLLLLVRHGIATKQNKKRTVLCVVLSLIGFAALYAGSGQYLEKRGLMGQPNSAVPAFWVALGIVFAGVCCLFVWKTTAPVREKLFFFAMCGTVYLAANQVLVYALKLIWGRVRFDDMMAAGSFFDFTPWYSPFGPGGSSFPSGHTANAAGIFMLLVLCDLFPALNKNRRLVFVVCWGYIAAMAVCRMVIGRHFLSDTLAASSLMAVLFFVLHRTKLYQKGLQQTLQNKPAK